MPSKFYLHDRTAPNDPGGTLPGATNVAGLTITVTATGASTNRHMAPDIGAAQTSSALTTSGVTTAQTNWFRRWISDQLAAQSIPSQTVTCSLGASESNANSDMFEGGKWYLALYRPQTASVVTVLCSATLMTEPGTTQTSIPDTEVSTAATAAAGDILVLEVFSTQNQAMATAYTNTIFYDGTTELSISNIASYVGFTTDVVLQTLQQDMGFASTAVLMGGLRRAWHRRRSGIFVPEYVV